MSKIVIFNGSPNKEGNTRTISKALAEEAAKEEHEVITYNIPDMNFSGCKACNNCYKIEDKPCIMDDDFNTVAEDIINADIIVYSMPVYFYTIPGEIKNMIDKMHAFMMARIDLSGKKLALISACALDDETVFEGMQIAVEKIAKHMGWELIGEVLVPGIGGLNSKTLEETNAIQEAKNLVNKF